MLDTFKARLKAKAKTLGVNLSQKRIDAIADRLHKKFPDVSDDAEHDSLIEEFHEMQPLDELAKQDDRLRTLENKQTNPKPSDQTPPQDITKKTGTETATGDDVPAWAKSLMQTVQTLATEKSQSSIKSKIAEKLKDKVPEKFYSKRALPEKEEDIDTFIQEVETDWTDLKQENNNLGFASNTPPGSSSSTNPTRDSVMKDIDDWASEGAEVKKK
jgi:hypothetical protein